MRTAIALGLLLPTALGAVLTQARAAPGEPGRSPAPVVSRRAVDSPVRPVAAPPAPVPEPGSRPLSRWGWPLSPRPAVLRGFTRPEHQWSAGHRGVDLAAQPGQPVLAAADGVVTFVGTVAGRGVVSVRHHGGWRTTYEPLSPVVTVGRPVRRGDRLGVVATTAGHCAPRACLHWGALLGADYRDPLTLLTHQRPVLLPLP
ncbi:M23 family metallopeptidase [Oryzihumus leptocrescens]|uniref:Peptidase M23-like protein n=1 Tax=Oryzihumus leptocrescens TaxID=297536 RepID=A0A542ZLS8_9MICO|nr:M23 family metallopeptidase [Oryzihumus leptocrescens]TQL61140.1 peptidase M23-like protein [Oryzihumus leptocrescens]